ncbi:MAG: hypothetical protein E6H07_07310 [Bacteroidetes bacterium]|nr:MAG: hypothetical protein E6H07_07310 [Bacteroidota bacterium]
MKRLIQLSGLACLSFIITGCPYESPLPLDAKPTEPIDTSLLGFWYGIVKDGSDYFGIEALEIAKETDSTYNIIRYGKAIKGDMVLPDTAYFTGFISYIDQQRFFNIETNIVEMIPRKNKKPEIRTTRIYYLSPFTVSHDTMQVRTITDGFYGRTPRWNSGEELKQKIRQLLSENKSIYDDIYKLSYRRIEKPKKFF